MLRLVWGTVGVAGLGLALLGAVLPIMPTVPFLIMAAYGFNRSSPRFHAMLMNHPIFGPQIHEWVEHRAISTRVKWFVCVTMALGLCVSFFLLPHLVWAGQVTVVTLVGIWIATRNRPPGELAAIAARGGDTAAAAAPAAPPTPPTGTNPPHPAGDKPPAT